ncbi:MAG: aminoglycoside phosphotransferase family protein [Gammaproteobacteria bacterium]|jgi:Ser/Thr protein kinase RdoA (MazF antagonist)
MTDLMAIARQFQLPSEMVSIEPYGAGIINDTYRVTLRDDRTTEELSTEHSAGHPRLGKHAILQRINGLVFPEPLKVMQNLDAVLSYAGEHADTASVRAEFLLPPLYRTHNDKSYWQDEEANVWRVMGFIENTRSDNVLQNLQQAWEAGNALGAFHRLVSELPIDQLHDTLPGFHITPAYLRHYDQVAGQAPALPATSTDRTAIEFCTEVIESNRTLADSLVNRQPPLTTRVMHGDPKLNNILFDQETGKAVSIIDLDTVKPGLIQFDIADCVRSCCNRSGELPEDPDSVTFDMEVCRQILDGYFIGAGDILSYADVDSLTDAIQLLPYELGVRFYSDYLAGNHYFKVSRPNDNLYRARTQFVLLQSIQQQREALANLMKELRSSL